MRKLLPLIFVVAAFWGWDRLHRPGQVADGETVEPTPLLAPGNESFKCDGRQYCSQMTSCAEATYFLRNCPNVKMDGNNDGVPCEKQWCR